MRWLFTDEVPFLDDLRALGETIIVEPTAPFLDDWDSIGDYPLQRLAIQHGVQVVALVDPVRNLPNGEQFAYARSHVQRLRMRKVYPIMVATRDPFTSTAYSNRRVRACGARIHDCMAYVSQHEPTVRAMATRRRATGFDAAKVLSATQHALKGKSYSPQRDSKNWL